MMVDMMNVLTNLMGVWNLPMLILSSSHPEELARMDLGLRKWLTPDTDWSASQTLLEAQVPKAALLYARDIFELNYALFRHPEGGEIISIGPWLREEVDVDGLYWIRELNKEDSLPELRHFYHSVRVMDQEILEQTLASLAACFFPGKELLIDHVEEAFPFTYGPVKTAYPQPAFWNSLTLESMEHHRQIKQRILDAVTNCKPNEAIALVRHRKDFRFFPPWMKNLYSDKTELLMANALLMEAANAAKIHPVYTQEVFDAFTGRILNLQKAEYSPIVCQMIGEYCDCIQKWSLSDYSGPVRLAIDTMRFQLKESPAPNMLAERSGLSLRQLNRRFRQETGISMMEYLARERIRAATIALETSDTSIGQVAESVGIIDANYFSRLFKKYTGQTPSQYRSNRFRPAKRE